MPKDPFPHLPEDGRGGSIWLTLRNYLLAGIAVATPLTITAWLVITVISLFDRIFKPLVPSVYNPETYLPFAIPGLGLVFALIFLTMLGAIAANILGRTAIGWGERILGRLPLIRNIYGAVKQIIDTIISQRERSFQDVALIEYPKEGSWALCFVTATAKGEVAEKLGDDYVGVFIPTTPNPTSGYLLYEKRSNLKILDMSVEEGAKLIISAGLVTPEDLAEAEQEAAHPDRNRRTPSSLPKR
ncbi:MULTISPECIES: DUF502 domain-containing protein [Euryhalocaulis]|uniref:DUF502 domain-containing protein n=1 Tax=Euryhalocaulis TaxID=1712422 RepID=UPI00039E3FC2|nr:MULTISPECIES: DUF502 domain-containing protein [Euryhalocaulis]